MLGWAGLRGAIPIWLATFPVIAGVGDDGADLQLDLLRRRHLDADPGRDLRAAGPAAGGDLERAGAAAAADRDRDHPRARRASPWSGACARATPQPATTVKELGLPREALVNLIVRDGEALPPRGSTEIEAGDELHIVSRLEASDELAELAEQLARRAAGRAAGAGDAAAGHPGVLRPALVAPRTADPATRESIEGVPVAHRLRTRRDGDGALVALADGRYAATGADLLAIGGRRRLAEWCARRVARQGLSSAERAWWQELAGALSAPAPRTDPPRGN